MAVPAPEATPRETRQAILAMVVAMLIFGVNDVFTKLARESWPTGQVLLVRGAMACVLLLIWVVVAGHARQLPALAQPMVILRAVLEGIVAVLFIAALGMMPLADAVAIMLVSTLIATALSVPLFGEAVGWRRWTAILVGFAGMLLVVRPTGEGLGVGGILAVGSALGVAVRDLATRYVPGRVPSLIVTLGTACGATLAGAALLPFEGTAPVEPHVIGYLACSAVLICLGNYTSVLAFRKAAIAAVAPFRYTSVLWATLGSGLVFGEWPGPVVGIGMALIVGSGLYTLHRERVRRIARPQLPPPPS